MRYELAGVDREAIGERGATDEHSEQHGVAVSHCQFDRPGLFAELHPSFYDDPLFAMPAGISDRSFIYHGRFAYDHRVVVALVWVNVQARVRGRVRCSVLPRMHGSPTTSRQYRASL